MLAGLTGQHIAKAGRLGEQRPDTNSPCGLFVPAEGQWPLAIGGPALGPQMQNRKQAHVTCVEVTGYFSAFSASLRSTAALTSTPA